MTKKEFIKKWLDSFTCDIPKKTLKKYGCIPPKGYLWSIFGFDLVKYEDKESARQIFDKIDKKNCLIINFDTDNETSKLIETTKYDEIKGWSETYIVNMDFTWTFIISHEDEYGPYFYKK